MLVNILDIYTKLPVGGSELQASTLQQARHFVAPQQQAYQDS